MCQSLFGLCPWIGKVTRKHQIRNWTHQNSQTKPEGLWQQTHMEWRHFYTDSLLRHVGGSTAAISFRRIKYIIEVFIAISSQSPWHFFYHTQTTSLQKCQLLGTTQTRDECRNTLNGNVLQTEIRGEEQQWTNANALLLTRKVLTCFLEKLWWYLNQRGLLEQSST